MFGLLAVGAGLLGSAIGSRSASKATNAQTQAGREQLALQERIYDETTERFQPYAEQGLNAFNQLAGEVSGGFQQSPGYQFAFDQGQRALEGSAAAGGNLRSGATMKALTNYGQGMANQEYGNYFNRLGTVAQMGQAAAGNQAAAGANFASGGSNSLANMGNAQSAGAIASGNALSGGINNAMSGYMMGQMMNGGGGGSLFGGNSWG